MESFSGMGGNVMYPYSPNGIDHLSCGERTTTGTILTIPAGSVWCGDIQISASISLAATATPRVTTAGTNVAPGGVISRLSLTGLALVTITDSNTITAIVMAPPENSVTLEFNTGGASSASVVCNGVIL